jgi:hypothetical protein
MTVYILLIRSNDQDMITVFNTLSIAYDAVKKSVQGTKDIYIQDYEYIGNEICERAHIAESMPIPVAWNTSKSWTAFLCRSPIYTNSNCHYPPPGGDSGSSSSYSGDEETDHE